MSTNKESSILLKESHTKIPKHSYEMSGVTEKYEDLLFDIDPFKKKRFQKMLQRNEDMIRNLKNIKQLQDNYILYN